MSTIFEVWVFNDPAFVRGVRKGIGYMCLAWVVIQLAPCTILGWLFR
jgi:hypothetical protein